MFTDGPHPPGDVIRPVRALAPLAAIGILAMTACGSSDSTDVPGAGPTTLQVAASTDVYGAVASRIGGDRVSVTSFVDNPNKDPHDYQSTPSDVLKVATATLVIANGGGYDDFMTTLVGAAGGDATLLDVATLSGLEGTTPDGQELNEHFWFDLSLMQDVADEIAKSLGEASPADSVTFTSNATSFRTDVDTLIALQDDIAEKHAGERVAATEPLPLYLLDACGLVNATPPDFMEASEEGQDPPAAVVQETLDLLQGPDKIKALLLNTQTATPSSDRLKAAAKDGGVPEVEVAETLSEPGQGYVDWMRAQITSLQAALEA